MTDSASFLHDEMFQMAPTAALPPFGFISPEACRPGRRQDLTLLDVIEAIHEFATDDAESTAVLRALLRSGAVRRRAPGR